MLTQPQVLLLHAGRSASDHAAASEHNSDADLAERHAAALAGATSRPMGLLERQDSANYEPRPPAMTERQDSAQNLQVIVKGLASWPERYSHAAPLRPDEVTYSMRSAPRQLVDSRGAAVAVERRPPDSHGSVACLCRPWKRKWQNSRPQAPRQQKHQSAD